MVRSLILFASLFIGALALAAPHQKRAPSVRCGGRSFTSAQVNEAVDNADSDAAPSTTYPHDYK